MKVILKKNFNPLGNAGEIIEVKDGYAMNYLIPRDIAYPATKGNIRALEEEKVQKARKEAKALEDARKFAEELSKVSITIPVKVGEDDKIFGAITTQMIADALKEKGYEVDKRKIEITEPIKALGIYEVKVKVHHAVETTVKTWVVRD